MVGTALILTLAGSAALLVSVLLWAKPWALVTVWLVAVAVVPSWWTVGIGLRVNVATIVGALALVVIMMSTRRRTVPTRADQWLMVFAVLAILTTAFFGTPLYATRDIILLWLLAYALGRLSGDRINVVLVGVGLLCAVWSIAEFVFGWHAFVDLRGPEAATEGWTAIQPRGDYDRSEASFGHAIALGGTLALTVPFAMKLVKGRWWVLGFLAVGTLVTFSRGPMLAFGAALLLTVIVDQHDKFKGGKLYLLAVAGIGYYYVVQTLFSDAEAGRQLQGSNAYRELTLTKTLSTVRPIGLASDTTVDPTTGAMSFSGITTVDNSPLLMALRFGWVPTLILVVMMGWLTLAVLRRKATGPAAIAVVAQWFILLTAAPLTQWQVFLLFAVGLAVTEILNSRPSSQLKPHRTRLASESVEDIEPTRFNGYP